MASSMRVKGSPNYVWFLDELLGKGAMGCVYVGRHRKTGHKFAIKVPNPETRLQYRDLHQRELDLLRQMGPHVNIVKFITIEHETYGKEDIIVMELCTGGSLYAILEDPKNYYGLPEEELILLLKHLTKALKHLWDHAIVHRDIKPGNILLYIADDGRHIYKLTDFGAAKDISEEGQFYSLFGTEEYLFPGMHRRALHGAEGGERVGFDLTADLWSLGVTLYQCATGILPFRPFKGVRKDRRTMQKLTTEKEFGIISQIEKSDGTIESSRQLPPTCPLSRGAQNFLVHILANILETNSNMKWTCDEFVEFSQDFCSRIVVHVFNFSAQEHLKLYMTETQNLTHLQESIAEQTDIRAANQELFLDHDRLEEIVKVDTPIKDFPETTEDKPILLVPKEPDVGSLQPSSALKLPEQKETTDGSLSQDAAWSREVSGIIHCAKAKVTRALVTQTLMLVIVENCISYVYKIEVQIQIQIDGIRTSFDTLSPIVEAWIRQAQEQLRDLKNKIASGHHSAREPHEKLTRKVDSINIYLRSMKRMLETVNNKYYQIVQKLKEKLPSKHIKIKPSCKKEDRCSDKISMLSEEAHKIWTIFKEDKRASLQHNDMEIHKFHKSENKKTLHKTLAHYNEHCLPNVKQMAKFVLSYISICIKFINRLGEMEGEVTSFSQAQTKLENHLSQMMTLFAQQMARHQWCSQCRRVIPVGPTSDDQGYKSATDTLSRLSSGELPRAGNNARLHGGAQGGSLGLPSGAHERHDDYSHRDTGTSASPRSEAQRSTDSSRHVRQSGHNRSTDQDYTLSTRTHDLHLGASASAGISSQSQRAGSQGHGGAMGLAQGPSRPSPGPAHLGVSLPQRQQWTDSQRMQQASSIEHQRDSQPSNIASQRLTTSASRHSSGQSERSSQTLNGISDSQLHDVLPDRPHASGLPMNQSDTTRSPTALERPSVHQNQSQVSKSLQSQADYMLPKPATDDTIYNRNMSMSMALSFQSRFASASLGAVASGRRSMDSNDRSKAHETIPVNSATPRYTPTEAILSESSYRASMDHVDSGNDILEVEGPSSLFQVEVDASAALGDSS